MTGFESTPRGQGRDWKHRLKQAHGLRELAGTRGRLVSALASYSRLQSTRSMAIIALPLFAFARAAKPRLNWGLREGAALRVADSVGGGVNTALWVRTKSSARTASLLLRYIAH